MRLNFIFLVFCFLCTQATAQYTIHFSVFNGTQRIQPDPEHYQESKNGIGLKQLKFYISGIQFVNAKGKVWKESESYHLLDIGNTDSVVVALPKDFLPETCSFFVGIDSVTNVSGAQTGDLDPMNGMYWTWQSGYINVKLEGVIEKNGQHSEFEYHLGGYAGEHRSIQSFTASNVATRLSIQIDLEHFFNSFDPQLLSHIMSPGKNAVMLSHLLIKSFKSMEHD